MVSVSKTISADPGADSFSITARFEGDCNISVRGTFDATVKVQKSYDDGSTWIDVKTYSESVETLWREPRGDFMWRIGIENGDYTSGTVTMRLLN